MALPTHTMTIRERLEQRERETLSPFASLAAESKGRLIREDEHSYRTAYQRDRDRILHTKSFRRLKHKTQVFLAPLDDHFRTRLTHTLEVMQISRTVSRALFLNEDLTEAIALGHDLGHTPFGHAGESVLNDLYAPGFHHAEQSLRVVDCLEQRRSGRGLNLTKEVRDGILNHSRGKAVLFGKSDHQGGTLEADVVSVCDAIAYINHDIEDAVRGGVITLDELPREALERLGRTSSQRIDAMVVGLIEGSQDGVVRMVDDVRQATMALRQYLYKSVYPSAPIEREISKAKKILRELYPRLLEHPITESLAGNPDDSVERRTVDFVAGMTDQYALHLYRKLFFPDSWPA
ncbi:MAG: hypothetical protein AMXMBFR84_29530 [Candidatus Hydrogenedentota bacterium]